MPYFNTGSKCISHNTFENRSNVRIMVTKLQLACQASILPRSYRQLVVQDRIPCSYRGRTVRSVGMSALAATSAQVILGSRVQYRH
jgi:hypothetical protein